MLSQSLPPAPSKFVVVFWPGVKQTQQRELLEPVTQEEEREEEISGAQFLCETIIRSLTLEEAPDHRPPRRAQHNSYKPHGGWRHCPPLIHREEQRKHEKGVCVCYQRVVLQ